MVFFNKRKSLLIKYALVIVGKFAFTKTLWVMKVSLSTLTFGSMNSVNANSHLRGKVKIIKSEKFVGMEAVCLIGRLVEGAVAKKMKVIGRDATQIISVESKVGDGYCTKPGAQVVLMVEGINKEDYPTGTEIIFEKTATEETKTKGRIIIA